MFLNRFPALKMSGDNIRTSMTMILEVALLVGGINAGSQIWGGTGIFMVVGLYISTRSLVVPLSKWRAAPLAAIVVGVLANIAAVIGVLPL
ncbi:MAG: YhfT family protein [Collinsella sp.]